MQQFATGNVNEREWQWRWKTPYYIHTTNTKLIWIFDADCKTLIPRCARNNNQFRIKYRPKIHNYSVVWAFYSCFVSSFNHVFRFLTFHSQAVYFSFCKNIISLNETHKFLFFLFGFGDHWKWITLPHFMFS